MSKLYILHEVVLYVLSKLSLEESGKPDNLCCPACDLPWLGAASSHVTGIQAFAYTSPYLAQ